MRTGDVEAINSFYLHSVSTSQHPIIGKEAGTRQLCTEITVFPKENKKKIKSTTLRSRCQFSVQLVGCSLQQSNRTKVDKTLSFKRN